MLHVIQMEFWNFGYICLSDVDIPASLLYGNQWLFALTCKRSWLWNVKPNPYWYWPSWHPRFRNSKIHVLKEEGTKKKKWKRKKNWEMSGKKKGKKKWKKKMNGNKEEGKREVRDSWLKTFLIFSILVLDGFLPTLLCIKCGTIAIDPGSHASRMKCS